MDKADFNSTDYFYKRYKSSDIFNTSNAKSSTNTSKQTNDTTNYQPIDKKTDMENSYKNVIIQKNKQSNIFFREKANEKDLVKSSIFVNRIKKSSIEKYKGKNKNTKNNEMKVMKNKQLSEKTPIDKEGI